MVVAYIILAGLLAWLCFAMMRPRRADDAYLRPPANRTQDDAPWSRWRRPRDPE